MSKPTIVIIGGGFCGAALTIQLIRQATGPIKIFLINKDNPVSKGIAYSTYNPKHVLNVPAAKMSLFPDDPDNFINWIKSKPEYSGLVNDDLNDAFLPRVIFGNYAGETFAEALKNKPESADVTIIEDEAVDVEQRGDGVNVILKNGESIAGHKAVLAIGNLTPGNPRILNEQFYLSKKYFSNPWKEDCVKGINAEDDILIIGTGLTMVDNVISLLDKNFSGKIFAVSTKGFFPLSHKKRKPYTDILQELHPPYGLRSLYGIFRKHIKTVLAQGIAGEAVVDAVRPKTQEIWLSLSLDDKIKFMSHVRHLWGVARHRLPREVHERMMALISEGRIKIIPGRLIDIIDAGEYAEVTLKERKSQSIRKLNVSRVINCTGPKTDLNMIEMPLIKNLLSKGMITSDEMKLGLNALPDGTIIQSDNSVSASLHAIGSPLKGILWESTAVPELRVQARNLAGELIRQLDMRISLVRNVIVR